MKKIRVLVIDDSILFQRILVQGLSNDRNIEVVATAGDPYDARDKIIEFQPDVITCDVEMPKMNGIDFVRKLMPQYPLPVVVVSSVDKAVLDAMEAGAVEFVAKPDARAANAMKSFIDEVTLKVKIASTINVSHWKAQLHIQRSRIENGIIDSKCQKVIAIGSSTGGTEAVHELLEILPGKIPGIIVVQHIPPKFSTMFAERLNNSTLFYVKEACTGDYLDCGKVLIAPGDKHVRIKKRGDRYVVECFEGEKVNGHCPSVDVLFQSVAKEAGRNAIGVILTGMGYDGAKGLLEMRKNGARTIGQDEKSSVVYGMPKAAYDIGGVEKQASLDAIPSAIISCLR